VNGGKCDNKNSVSQTLRFSLDSLSRIHKQLEKVILGLEIPILAVLVPDSHCCVAPPFPVFCQLEV
jgi:hypothetical protein